MKPIKLKALTLASAITIWEIVGRAKVFPPLIFPTVSGAILWGFNNWMRLIDATSYTLKLLTIALSLSTVTCFIIGTIAYINKDFRSSLEVLMAVFNPLPSISLLPFAILWFGFGENPIIFVTYFGSLWPFTYNIINGLTTIDKSLLEAGILLSDGDGWSLFRYIIFPLALPNIITGFRSAWGISWRSVVAAELVFGAVGMNGGIGWLVYACRFNLNPEGMVASIFCISIIDR
ncbi:unnamed protein product [marine sediment metagenome]|uniref:ABC transmembrane type-1 domain-containing protein n=2 Tax=marine sediment metagenome TaxID=412755 RepID=X0YUW0_9ZZZZ